jgi:hypothetical protein
MGQDICCAGAVPGEPTSKVERTPLRNATIPLGRASDRNDATRGQALPSSAA